MADHAWCHDIARDAAVRAAEDNRTGPLPTLAEAIAAVRERRSEQTKGDEMSQGMRTERVTLEVTYRWSNPPSKWNWNHVITSPMVTLKEGESVRVVEEAERQEPPTTKTATTENDYVSPAPVSRPAETRQTQAERIRGGWWFPKYDKPSAPPPPPPAPPRVHRGSGVFDDNGDELPWEGVVAMLTDERDAAIREREELRVKRDELQTGCNRLNAQLAKKDSPYKTALDAAIKGMERAQRERDDAINEYHSVSAGRDAVSREREELKARVAELEAARGGGEQPPVAWMCEWTDHVGLHQAKADAEDEAAGDVVPQPLYRQTPQPRGWLTKEERALIAGITDDDEYTEEGQDIAKGLLARSSPPLVVLPENPYHPSGLREGFEHALRSVRNELVNAGVPVKEVGQ